MPTTIPLPAVIQGPAYVTHGGVTLYTQRDVAVQYVTESWDPESGFGKLGRRLKSRSFKITFTPVGMLTATILNYLYSQYAAAPSGYPSSVGNSIITGALVVVSIPQKKSYTYTMAGISKPPPLQLSPTMTAYGAMEYTAIGKVSEAPTSADFFKTDNGTVGSLDTSFDQSKIVSDIYSISYNFAATGAPYTAMGSVDGIKFNFNSEVKPVPMGDVGIGDVILASIGMDAEFRPSNLTETQLDAMLLLQGTGALLPGMPFAGGLTPDARNLVVPVVATGTQGGFAATMACAGAETTGLGYQIGEHRLKAVKFTTQRQWGTGAETALFSFSGSY